MLCPFAAPVVAHIKMAASVTSVKVGELSKAEYLKRYLSNDDDAKKSKGKLKKKRRKVTGKGLKIVDDDVDWRQTVAEENDAEDDDEEAPVIAEVIDERPDDVRMMEIFRSSSRWKAIGEDENKEEDIQPEPLTEKSSRRKARHDSPDASPPRRARHDSPDMSPPRKKRHDSPNTSPPKKKRHHSPDMSSPRRKRHDSPDMSPPRKKRQDSPDMSPPRRKRHDSPDMSPPRKKRQDSPDMSPPRRKRHDSPDMSPPRHRSGKSTKAQSASCRRDSDSDQSPPRKKQQKGRRDSDSDQSLPRRAKRRGKESDDDLSPPRKGNSMLSGGKAGLISSDVLRNEKEEARRRDGNNRDLENASRHAQTVFRDKSGKKRDLESEREEQKRKAGEKAAKDEKYAQWGKGLAQGQMEQQRLEDAVHEAQKPLARNYDDEDLDRMLREQVREGDPMAAMLQRKKERKTQGAKEKPQYKGPPPPLNRFNILPGYRWDGVNRSNGFEEKRYTRIADKKALQEEAYKWSVEDM
ncbi:BUD13 homolog isoform X2 [Corythoichthys intestinalis]|uniref:BUD13 homolog isoform X2 n=1 Tax=Corythoichthys intestinalis TaxID=161448 RepID=UPI0025A55D8F|nr:BUD13 homolog isoform X2 [Corythoichthys intestinalis]